MTSTPTRVLIAAENIDEIEHLARRHGWALLRDPDTRILAFEPDLQVYLKQQGIAYVRTSALVDATAHAELAALSHRLLGIVRRDFGLRDEFGVASGYANAFVFYTRESCCTRSGSS